MSILVKLKTDNQVGVSPKHRSDRAQLQETVKQLHSLSRLKYGESQDLHFSWERNSSREVYPLFPSTHPLHDIYFVIDEVTKNRFHLSSDSEIVEFCVEI